MQARILIVDDDRLNAMVFTVPHHHPHFRR
jgi:hypothetical protein